MTHEKWEFRADPEEYSTGLDLAEQQAVGYCWVWCYTPIIPDTQKAEIRRPTGNTLAKLHFGKQTGHGGAYLQFQLSGRYR
jgi:hypothetical protein